MTYTQLSEQTGISGRVLSEISALADRYGLDKAILMHQGPQGIIAVRAILTLLSAAETR